MKCYPFRPGSTRCIRLADCRRGQGLPFLQLAGGRAAGSWIRDELVAPVFDGHWDFYSNRKINNGFDLNEFYLLLDGENMLIQRLRYARKTLQM